MNTEDIQNHRTRVGAKRREKTRARLLESALLVFAQKGPQAVIEDVIAQAGVARGSFYNYFRTNDELLEAVAAEINDDLLRAIDPVVQLRADPAERIASGARLLLRAVRRFPLYGHFMAGLPFPTANSSLLGVQYLARDVAAGVRCRRFDDIDQRMGIDLLAGVIVSAACTIAREGMDTGYADASARIVLRALGMEDQEAMRIASLPLPAFELPADSILRRTQLFEDQPPWPGPDLI